MGMGIMTRLTENRRQWLLLGIAVIFHIVGIAGIGLLHHQAIIAATPLHLLLMSILLVLSFQHRLKRFSRWAIPVAVVCFAAEWVSVHYGWLFGGYVYRSVLGIKWLDVPLIIGLNWVLVGAGAISCAERLKLPGWATVLLAATLATAYDYILEPLAIRLNYWDWDLATVPAYNYICWWGLSALSAMLWVRVKLRGNIFAAGLFIIQIIFFIVLRILL